MLSSGQPPQVTKTNAYIFLQKKLTSLITRSFRSDTPQTSLLSLTIQLVAKVADDAETPQIPNATQSLPLSKHRHQRPSYSSRHSKDLFIP
jgi:hypothetical protein